MNIYTNTYFKCNIIFKLSDKYNQQVSNYIFQLLHFNIDEKIESSLLVKNQIQSHCIRSTNQMSILRVNRSKTKYRDLHNGMITWNSLPGELKVNVSFSVFMCRGRNFYLGKYLYKDVERHCDCTFFSFERIN